MRTALEGARKGAPATELVSDGTSAESLLRHITAWLDEAKAEEVVTIDLKGKSSIADFMVVASGRSDRHVGAIAEQLQRKLKQLAGVRARIEGLEACDWVLIDAGDVIVHVFRPEVRAFYKLERMWSADRPTEAPAH
jgi:ribosome-associated protein